MARKRRGLGLSPARHAAKAQDWLRSSERILSMATKLAKKNPCRAIEHFTDAASEALVAETQAVEGGDGAASARAGRLHETAVRRQQTAVRACTRRRH